MGIAHPSYQRLVTEGGSPILDHNSMLGKFSQISELRASWQNFTTN